MIEYIKKYVMYGIGFGSFLVVLNLMVAQLLGWEENFQMLTKNFTQNALGMILITVVFYVLNIVYHIKRFNFMTQVGLQLGGGIVFGFMISIFLGWNALNNDYVSLIIAFGNFSLIAVLYWLISYLYNWNEARKINKKIKERVNES